MATYRAPAVQKPTVEVLAKIAETLGFRMTPEELEEYREIIAESIGHLTALNDLPEPVLLPVKYPRTPGYRPPPEENPYNAWYYKTDIRGAVSGKLKGKRIAIKDNVAVAGVPMMNGSKLLQGYTPEYDATVVTRILDAGGKILGKATCEDMCYGSSSCTTSLGPVSNPHEKTRSAGGSSSGCAVLVQQGEVDMAIGGDQGGSLRTPASFVGIVSLKPTFGLVPYTGIIPIEGSVDHTGPMAATVKDCALLLEVIAGYDDGLDPRQHPETKVVNYTELVATDLFGMKIGLLEEGFSHCEADVKELVRASGQKLDTVGATVEDVSMPLHESGPLIYSAPCTLGGYNTLVKNAGCTLGQGGFQSTSLIDHMRNSLEAQPNCNISDRMKGDCMESEYIKQNYGCHYYVKGQNLTMMLTRAYNEVLEKYDVIIMPTLPHKAHKLPPEDVSLRDFLDHCNSATGNVCPFNATGHPALSINAGFSEGLPVGMMIVGKKFDDATVLKVAYAFEQIRDNK